MYIFIPNMKFLCSNLCLGGLLIDANADDAMLTTMHDGQIMITQVRLVLYQMSQKYHT